MRSRARGQTLFNNINVILYSNIKSPSIGSGVGMNVRAVSPQDIVGQEASTLRVMGLQVLLVPCPIPVPLLLVVLDGIVVHADRTELGMCAVLELGDPLVLAVIRSAQLHY